MPNPSSTNGLLAQVPTYLCPADGIPHAPNPVFRNYGKSNYVAMAGVMDTYDPNALTPSERVKTKIQAIPDGSSNTVAVCERDSVISIAAIWPGATNQTTGSNRALCIWRPNYPARPGPKTGCCTSDSTNTIPGEIPGRDPCIRLAVTSGHAGGVNFAFADGHVSFVAETVETSPTAKGQPPLDPPASGPNGCLPGKTNFVYQKMFWADDGFPLGDY